MNWNTVHLLDDGARAAFPLRLVQLTLLVSLSTLVPRARLSFEAPPLSRDLCLDCRMLGLCWVGFCLGGDIGLLLLLAERPERVLLIAAMSRTRFTDHRASPRSPRPKAESFPGGKSPMQPYNKTA